MTTKSLNDIATKIFSTCNDEELRALNRMIIDKLNSSRHLASAIAKAQFFVGQHVAFENNQGKLIKAEVIKLNPKNIRCHEFGTPDHAFWNVPPSLLKPA